ncbi:hypothetical protein GCM10010446_68850 [Streptomyces enissocaesilis]|uniref:Uncharacterized protein n=1 Tax=Streptomyces enissocaesilis TaxID=332589 RepID=A0ABP6K8C7_9ACTN
MLGPIGEDLDDGAPRQAALPRHALREGRKARPERLTALARPGDGRSRFRRGLTRPYGLSRPAPLLGVQPVPVPPLGARRTPRLAQTAPGRAGEAAYDPVLPAGTASRG